MIFFPIFLLGFISGFILFAKVLLYKGGGLPRDDCRISVIIPARNEEKNLPFILQSLKEQTINPFEIIVVDDSSSDRTAEIAASYGARVIRNTTLPGGWTGKNWAVWNGYLNCSGDLLVFLDADVRLAPGALEALIHTRERSGGVISVVPYHYTEEFYERLAQLPCLLGIFAFTSPFERNNGNKGLYGSCIVVTREDYEKINGHSSIQGELLDDLGLGRKFAEAGISVNNYIGYNMVSFRMYPGGLKSLVQGFGKGAVLSTAVLKPVTVALIAAWMAGLLAAEYATMFLVAFGHPWAMAFVVLYLLYTMQIIYINRWTGSYGKIVPVLHFLSSALFIFIMIYSIWMVTCLGYVSWKGRRIPVRRGRGT